MTDNRKRLAELGQALYGERWQRSVGKALGKDIKQIQRWINGEHGAPSDEVIEQLKQHGRQRAAEIMREVRG